MGGENRQNGLRAGAGVIRLHGHRGARGLMPENTMAGFEFALACGVGAIEFDVLFTRDCIPVLTHYPEMLPYLTRDSAGNWISEIGLSVNHMTLEEVRSYNVGGVQAGSDYAKSFPDQAFLEAAYIPDLAQLCELLVLPQHRGVWLNLEIKSNPHHPEYTPPIPEMVAAVLKVLHAFDLGKRTILQCFNWQVLREVARQAPDMIRSYLGDLPNDDTPAEETIYEGSEWMDGISLAGYDGNLPAIVDDLGGQVWSPYFADIDAAMVRDAQARGLVVNVWTVNRIADIDAMIALRVDGIITDYPGRVQQRLLAHGLDWRDRE
jgi:glycerophosphoryl diester phosphodiesterase